MYMGALEGETLAQATERTKKRWPETFMYSSIFWPIANTVNFTYVGPQHRVLYVGAVGITWNAFLSWKTRAAALEESKES
jgi:protein Mpv17